MVQGYGVAKSGSTSEVNGKKCDIFKGKERRLGHDAQLEYHIWKGVPLKMVAKTPDGNEITELQSITLPDNVDASKFTIPKGYKVE